MSLTKKKKQEFVSDLDEQSFVDGSEVVYTFSNGWSIRQINTYRDAVREGILMSNCFCPNDADEHALWEWVSHPETQWERYVDDMPIRISQEEAEQYIPFDSVYPFWGDLTKIDLSLKWPGNTVLSLRDEMNYPVATGTEDEIVGRHNSDLKPDYYRMFQEFFAASAPDKMNWLVPA